MRTGFVWHERYFWFDTGGVLPALPGCEPYPHWDTPNSRRRIKNLLDASGLIDSLVVLKPKTAARDDLLRFHSEAYVDQVKALSDADGGETGVLAHLGPGDFDIALLALGGCMTAVDAVLAGTVDNAYALVRPCGHHATRDLGMGNAIFCNIALAIMKARAERRVGRVAVVDWDVHHGNGTQQAFYADPETLTISIHQDSNFPPGSGTMDERGEGAGFGCNINVPLPPGSGHGAYVAVMQRVVVPAIERFRPDLIAVASGLDACGGDPMARMMCHGETYREMTRLLLACASRCCGGKLVACHEGGYSELAAPFMALAILEEMCGIRSGVVDPVSPLIAGFGGQELQPHQDAVITRAAALASAIRS